MENKKAKNVLLVIMGALIIAELVEIFFKISSIQSFNKIMTLLPRVISLVFTALYGFWFYKKPHGNMLKYAMLLFALTTILSSCNYMLIRDNKVYIARILVSAVICYCAGRLNRIEQNKIILPLVAVVFLATSIYFAIMYSNGSFLSIVPHFRSTINYLTLMIAYFVRYDEHKEAGIMDAPKQ